MTEATPTQPAATPTERALTAEGARQFVLDKIEAASYHRNYRQACIDIQAFLLDAERAARAEPGLREAARKLVDWIDSGGDPRAWPNASYLNDLRTALRSDSSDCPKCGEWRDNPTADCANCGHHEHRVSEEADRGGAMDGTCLDCGQTIARSGAGGFVGPWYPAALEEAHGEPQEGKR